jgi:hypothetical protein
VTASFFLKKNTDTDIVSSVMGLLFGSVLSGVGMYAYVVQEYRVSNELLTEDIFVSSLDLFSRLVLTQQESASLSSTDRSIRESPRGQGWRKEVITHNHARF